MAEHSSREAAVLAFLDDIAHLHMHGFLLSVNGETVAEGSWAPFTAEKMHRMYSVSKSVVSLAIGILFGDGKLSLEDHIVDHFPEYADTASDLLREVTIRDMLRMATCYDRATYNVFQQDWTKTYFSAEPSHVPGTVFSYDTSASQVMCALVEKLSGCDILSFMEERLFSRIGMTDGKKWLRDGTGTSQGGTGLLLSLRDFGKLADFCLTDGMGIVPAEYLKAATSCQIQTPERGAREERYGYGYQFWQMREGFSMYGMGGQMAMCLPERGITLVTTGNMMMDGTAVQPLYDAFFRNLSRVDTLPSDVEKAKELGVRLSELRFTPAGGTNDRCCEIALAKGTLPFTHIRIEKDTVTMTVQGTDYTLPYQTDGWARGVFPTLTEHCLVSGGWAGERFHLHCEMDEDFTAAADVYVVVKGERATVRSVGTLFEMTPVSWNGQDYGNVLKL